jgi:hypothetical protein
VTRLPRALLAPSRALLVALAVAVGCGTGGLAQPWTDGPRPLSLDAGGASAEPVDYAPRIDSAAAWAALSARPDTEHMANTEVVKFIFDRTDGRVYFQQSVRYPVHYDFAVKFLSTKDHPVLDPTVFNRTEYHSPDRRFSLGTLTHHADADIWTLEFFAGDEIDLDAAAKAFHAVRGRVFFGGRLRYRPVPAAHERDLARARALMPVVTTDEIFGKIIYQPLELGEAYGYLRVFAPGEKLDPTTLRPYDLVVLGDLPEDIPVVAGVISNQIQAPLGHINVLCHNRNTPNMALRGATSDARVLALRDKLARLVVKGQSFRIEPATKAEAELSWAAKRPKEGYTPARDDRDIGMPLLTEPKATEVSLTGAKAAQLAMVARALPIGSVPKAFSLPFHAYARFLAVNGLGPRIDSMLASREFQEDPERRRRDLQGLRDAMEAGTVPADVLQPLMARIKAVMPAGALRFRSSTNSEDLPGFNGAGLYRSAKVANPSSEDEVRGALRRVWASVWLWGAFEERAFYRIDHRAVGMAILVQVSIDAIAASGVAITANPFNQGQPAYFINAQAAGGSVTGARGDEVPEQILYYTFQDGRGFERLSKSSRMGGADLLAAPEVEELARQMTIIHKAFTGEEDGTSGRAVDIEFLVASPSRKVLIVQARPYALTWAGDRRWKWAP